MKQRADRVHLLSLSSTSRPNPIGGLIDFSREVGWNKGLYVRFRSQKK